MAYSQDDDELQDLRDAIDTLESASKTPARSRATKLTPTVDEICEHAFQFGFRGAELRRLVELLTIKTELDQTSTTTLIKNLYPATQVGSDIVVMVVNSLGQAKRNPSASTQAGLVKWLTAIHDVLDDQMSLSRLYSVLFNLLDMISIRTPLCQLLAVITLRKHVRPFRIQRLLELSQQTANEPALLNLLRVYKNFSPEIIIGAIPSARLAPSSLPDPEWRQRLRAIQQVAASMSGDTVNLQGFRVARYSARIGKHSVIPEVHTFRAGETKRTLEEIQNAEGFVEHMENIEPPSQSVAALRDPLMQKYLMLGCSSDVERRLEFWLTRYFEEEMDNIREGFGLSATLPETLGGVVSYAEASKSLLPVVERFLGVYLPIWNGSSDLGAILDLMSYLPPQPFPALHGRMLSILENSVLSGAEAPYTALLDFYASLAQRWIASQSPLSQTNLASGFTRTNALFDLFTHVTTLAESALAANQRAAAAILDFYERIADLTIAQIAEGKQFLPPMLPSQTLTYSLILTPSLSAFSRICALLVTYKRAFERQDAGVTRVYQADATNLLNGYLMDSCNLIWRSRALNNTDNNAEGLLCPEEVVTSLQAYLTDIERDYSVHTIFDFSHNALIAGIASAAFGDVEGKAQMQTTEEVTKHAGPVSQRSLQVLGKEGGVVMSWKEYRVEVLNWLEAHGIEGIKKLMFATMKDLMK